MMMITGVFHDNHCRRWPDWDSGCQPRAELSQPVTTTTSGIANQHSQARGPEHHHHHHVMAETSVTHGGQQEVSHHSESSGHGQTLSAFSFHGDY